MKIQWIPSFLSSPDDTSDYFAFDKNNRYIICKTKETDAVHFLIYDKMFNDYIKLTADPSNPKISTQYDDDSIWNFMQYFLPISLEQMLIVIQSGETSVLLLLVTFDLHQKTYKFINYVTITKCQQPEFVKDGEILGLFFKTSIDGEMVGLVDNETSFFVLLYITVEESLIKLGEKIRFNHKPYADFTYPIDLYLRNNKLWYIRRVDHDITFLPNIMGYSPPSVPPQNHNLRICYFNLEEKVPSEIFVDEIEIEEEKAKLILHWVQDSLVYLQRGTKFNVLNLLNLQWKSEALDCGLVFKHGYTVLHGNIRQPLFLPNFTYF
uniref:Uncharacterized protein n=1 Tax=Panagrolaimus superbus TaxID=310955 RepID=A0A914Y1B9_9BILA